MAPHTSVLTLHCPDSSGIVADVATWIGAGGGNIVDDHVVWVLKLSPGNVLERLKGVECVVVNAVENLDLARC